MVPDSTNKVGRMDPNSLILQVIQKIKMENDHHNN